MNGWRTLAFNALAAAPVIIELVATLLVDPEFGNLIPEEHMDTYLVIVTLANMYLRSITSTPMGRA